jgi:Na+-transporting methylmalonyl-CoA/oxaloacetate decarboxylase gamma subunit
MNTNLKSNSLFLLILLSIVLFVAALIWKEFSIDNSEKITNKEIQPIKEKTNKAIVRDTNIETIIAQPIPEEIESDNRKIVEPDNKQKKETLQRRLNMSLMLKTPEEVMDVIITYQAQGKDELANEYLDYLIETFPDYEIPNF